ncbi:MAG: hypothetical protein ABSA08_01000 [Acidimicrobiales bacterium]
MTVAPEITQSELDDLHAALSGLIEVQFEVLKLPREILIGFEPSQIGTIVGVLMDACIPQLDKIVQGQGELFRALGLVKHEGILKDREGYPDYLHEPSGKRLELKLLYVDPAEAVMKVTETRREPSARLTQKVTVKNVDPSRDVMLLLAYQLQPHRHDAELYCPTITNLAVFSMIECIRARDHRLRVSGGYWFGDFETPAILSRIGKAKKSNGLPVDTEHYGRKESEGYDFNEDTNFGKLKRIPYQPLQRFLRDNGADYSVTGMYPKPWALGRKGAKAAQLGLLDLSATEVQELLE